MSRALETDNAAITRLVDQLETQQLVKRRINPDDRCQMRITIRAVERNNYPIWLVYWPVFCVAMKFLYLDMLAPSRLEYEAKSSAIRGNYFFPRP